MSDNDNDITCVFCGQVTFQKIIKWTSETIKKCMTVLEYRRNKPVLRKSRTMYNTLEFSPETLINQGYHAKCYKLFTAIKVPAGFQRSEEQKSAVEYDNAPEVFGESFEPQITINTIKTEAVDMLSNKKRKSSNFVPELDNQFHTDEPARKEDIPPVKCLICDKSRKRHRGREVPLAVNKFRTVKILKTAALEYNDIEVLEKMSYYASDSVITYHKCCKDQYLRGILKRDDSEYTKQRKVSKTAYTLLCNMLEEYVVKNNEYLSFEQVKKEYQKLLAEQFKLLSNSISISFSDRYLERKLMNTFDHKIKIMYADRKKFLAPFIPNVLAFYVQHNGRRRKITFSCTSSREERELEESEEETDLEEEEEIDMPTLRGLPEDCRAEDYITGDCVYLKENL